jgi:hypothetical protein
LSAEHPDWHQTTELTSLKEQETVKGLEEQSVRLMDGTQDFLASSSQFSQETDDYATSANTTSP